MFGADSAGIHALFAHVPRIQLIASPLLAPVLTVSGLSDITSVHEPPDLAAVRTIPHEVSEAPRSQDSVTGGGGGPSASHA